MEYDASAEKDEFHKVPMEQVAFQAEEKMEYQRSLYFQEAGEEKNHTTDRLISSRANRGINNWSMHLKFQFMQRLIVKVNDCKSRIIHAARSFETQEAT